MLSTKALCTAVLPYCPKCGTITTAKVNLNEFEIPVCEKCEAYFDLYQLFLNGKYWPEFRLNDLE